MRDGEHTAWNIAADAMLNLDLVQAGCRTLGQKGILPAKLASATTWSGLASRTRRTINRAAGAGVDRSQ